MQALRAAADRIVDAIAASTAPAQPAAAAPAGASKPAAATGAPASALLAQHSQLARMQGGTDSSASGATAGADSIAAAADLHAADEAARMAAEWLALLAKGPVGDAPAQAGLAGLAAALLVCSSPRCVCRHQPEVAAGVAACQC